MLRSFLLAALLAGPATDVTPADPPGPPAVEARSIAITFDDAPLPADGYLSGPERTKRLIAALRSAGVPQAAFFCNTVRFDEQGRQRIEAYAKAGHLLANHSHGHLDLHRLGAGAFLADVRRADGILAGFPGVRKWLRFPYLHEGRTVEERDAVRAGLRNAGYRPGYVTIDNYDWYMESLFQEAVATGRKVDLDRLRDAYVEILTDGVEFYDGIARESLGRSPRHVLLLHENDLAALFIDDLVDALRRRGWHVVSPDEAYADPIADMEPQTLLLGQGRIVALAADRGYAGSKRRWEDEAELRAEFERRGIWE